MSSSLGNRIKAARKAAKLTQAELAERLGVKNTTISNWEKGVSKPDADQIERLCWELNVEPNYFFISEQGEVMNIVMRAMPGYVDPMEELMKHAVEFDDFTYAMHGASGDLTDRDKQILLDMANQLAQANRDRKKNASGENTD